MLPAGGDARGETRAFTADHARFLASLRKARLRTLEFDVSGTGQWLSRSIGKAQAFASQRQMRTLEESYSDCETALLYWTGPYVLAQGDFTPWNIRNLGSQSFVTAWAPPTPDASPPADWLRSLTTQRALNSRPVTGPGL